MVGTQQSPIEMPDPLIEIQRAKIEAREEFHAAILSQQNLRHAEIAALTARLDGMAEASRLLAENVNRVPTLLDRESLRIDTLFNQKVNSVFDLFNEKISSIGTQFKERDLRTDQDKVAASTAVTAALTALKEMIALQNTSNTAAISKSEASVAIAIESLNRAIASMKDVVMGEITNIKQRLDRGEGGDIGVRASKADTHTSMMGALGIAGGIVGALSLLAVLVFGTMNVYRTQPPAAIIAPGGVTLK